MVCEMDTFSRRAARVSAVWIISKAKEIRSIHYIMPVPPARIDMAAADRLLRRAAARAAGGPACEAAGGTRRAGPVLLREEARALRRRRRQNVLWPRMRACWWQEWVVCRSSIILPVAYPL